MSILKIAGVITAIIGLYYLCFAWPVKVKRVFRDTYGENGWSWSVSLLLALFTVAAICESGNDPWFAVLLVVLIVMCIFAILICIQRGKRVGASLGETLSLILSQFLSAVGIVFVVLLLVDAASGKKKKK